MFVFYVSLLVLLTGGCQAITRFPQNAAVYAGQTVTLNCQTESHSSVWWKYKPIGPNEPECLLFNSKIVTECGCDNCTISTAEPGQYDLHITNTRQSHAGTYICVDSKETNKNVSKADSHSAELIVLVSVPECGNNGTGSSALLLDDNYSVRMWCRVEFRGNFAPTMGWGNKATDKVIPSRTTNYQNRKVESEILIQLKHDDNHEDIAYSCTTYFNQSFYEAHASTYSVAKNAPDYTYNWTSQDESRASRSIAFQESSTETNYQRMDNDTFSISTMMTTLVIVISLLMILIFCTIFLKLSSKGCFKNVSSAGPNLVSHTNTEGISNIFYEDPHAGATSPINGGRTNHAIQAYYEDPGQILDQSSPDTREDEIVQFRQTPDRVPLSSTTMRHDHVYSLEPAQRSTRHQQVRLQNEAPSIITGSLTHEMNTDGDGGPGAYEDVVDILRNINQSEERQAAAVDDGVHMQTPAFNVGTDGTIYTQVQLGRGRGGSMSPTTPQPRTIQPLFSTSVYAPIDHTTRIVPLPPTTRRH